MDGELWTSFIRTDDYLLYLPVWRAVRQQMASVYRAEGVSENLRLEGAALPRKSRDSSGGNIHRVLSW
jgi:hypothetical protein